MSGLTMPLAMAFLFQVRPYAYTTGTRQRCRLTSVLRALYLTCKLLYSSFAFTASILRRSCRWVPACRVKEWRKARPFAQCRRYGRRVLDSESVRMFWMVFWMLSRI
jgi:hypothetical protein